MERIGRYEVKGELGRGGFGVVYRAYDPLMRRAVAIKVLSATDPGLVARFRAEAGVNLHHKNIVTVYDFVDSGGESYLVMEFLEGKTLRDAICAAVPLSLLEKVTILYQMAEGLKHAHAQRVIHRDIKPENVIVLPDGLAKILDFGIALFSDRATRYTATGYMIGSIQYMAPDLINGGDADETTDVYAYGVTAYELLTARNPFAGTNHAHSMNLVLNVEPETLRRLQPACPEALELMVHRAIAKQRARRYSNVHDLLLDLAPIVASLRENWAKTLCTEVSALLGKGDLDGAGSCLKRVLDLDPAHSEAQSLRKEIDRRRDHPESVRAVTVYDRFIAALDEWCRYLAVIPSEISTTRHRLETLGGRTGSSELVQTILEVAIRTTDVDLDPYHRDEFQQRALDNLITSALFTVIFPKQYDAFDPRRHSIVARQKAPSVQYRFKIADVARRGFEYRGKVVRKAEVRVYD
jgi:serine/threonine protein kinase